MEWTNDKTLQLIELYRTKECLWNPKSSFYKLLNKKNDAWQGIATEMNCNTIEVKKKINSLLASFRRERQKESTTKTSGSGAGEQYYSTWFAFKSLDFLRDKFTPKSTLNTEEIQERDATVNINRFDEEKKKKEGMVFKFTEKKRHCRRNNNVYRPYKR
ncbi:unnamed protein product [Acanthoscelides obtectus]|uniref:MADF domain-containing protein n=1 Tax=Acanthoscelides obtectus TaxID=200917 RepID=A0A9P0NYH1_ACAOB|nr:unnamed protein product [Acanthoscelides obtectus]CAK1654230.1 hypothetical protein AOBTE_LOCUS18484 [Acanthoscelides obtectus]